ncbi:MobC family plasmid mobilization relaxosome protein [Leifsonia shinshuensis]
MADKEPKGRMFSRRRRANVEGGRQRKHEVWVSDVEEGVLQRLASAQHVTVPRFLVEAALSSEARETPTQRREMMVELIRLHRTLGAMANNVNQMAKATNAGSDLPAELHSTVSRLREIAEQVDGVLDGMHS